MWLWTIYFLSPSFLICRAGIIAHTPIGLGQECNKVHGTWVAQLIKSLTLDLVSGLDLRALSSSHTLGSKLVVEPTKKKKYSEA